jgi:hypothetical protein
MCPNRILGGTIYAISPEGQWLLADPDAPRDRAKKRKTLCVLCASVVKISHWGSRFAGF